MRICKTEGCSGEVPRNYNDKGLCVNNRQVFCKDHFVGSRSMNPMFSWYENIKNRSVKKGLDFDITIADIQDIKPDDMICPVLGIKMQHGDDTGRNTSPSVDRIDSSKGYTKDNIQVISKLANSMKQNATPEQLLLFANWINKTYN